MSDLLDNLAHTLGAGREIRVGAGWRVRCTAHQDENPSLSLNTGTKQAVVWKCQAGCSNAAVIRGMIELGIQPQAAGLKAWPGETPDNVIRFKPRNPAAQKKTPAPEPASRITARTHFQIKDITGKYIATHTRLDYDDSSKKVVWSIDSKPGLGGLKKIDLPLYRTETLAGLAPGTRVVVCEGEKAADAAAAHGIVALGTVTGAGSIPSDDVLKVLTPLAIFLFPDNDDAGRQHMDRIAERLHAMGHQVRMIHWKEAPPSGDAADFTVTDEAWAALFDDAAAWTPAEPKVSASTESRANVGSSFYLTDTAVMFRADEGDEFVCSRLEIAAATRDASGDDWGRLALWKDDDGRDHSWAIPMRLFGGSGQELREHLLAGGVHIGSHRHDASRLSMYLQSATPTARATSVSRLGWHDANFVLPDATINKQSDDRIVLQTEQPLEHALRVSGSLEEWRGNVAALCIDNSRLLTAVSASFAAPLLYLLDEENGGIHFRGASSIGKTTVLRVGSSVAGGGGVSGYLRSWRSTDNAFEPVMAAHCDLPLALDEIGQVDAKKVAEIAYMLANGRGKQRARRDGTGRPAATWRTLFQSTGEISLADKVAESGGRATAGQEIRILDIPADAGVGRGCFENIHKAADGDGFSRRLNKASRKYYGSALRAFLDELVKHREAHVEWLKEKRKEFEQSFDLVRVDGQIRRAIGRFSLIAAAGELATKLKITGWPAGAAAEGVEKCAHAWLKARDGTGPAELEAAVRQVRQFIEQHGDDRFTDTNGPARVTVGRVGFKKKDDAGTLYMVLPESWRSELCRGFDRAAVAAELARRGFLLTDPAGKFSRVERISQLSDGSHRVYVISSAILEESPEEAEIDRLSAADAK